MGFDVSTVLPDLSRWRADPVAFVEDAVRDPETGAPFVLYPEEQRFLCEGFTLTRDGRLPYPELVFAAPKKSGKTALGALGLLYTTVALGGRFAEGYCIANDLEQSSSRVFRAAARMVEASPLLRRAGEVFKDKIIFRSTGTEIVAVAADYVSNAGANPTISVFDELWGYQTERSHRLWDEMVPVPTRAVSVRLTVTYAGFEAESALLEALYTRGLKGEQIARDLYRQPGLLMFWTHDCLAPWQKPAWVEQMRNTLRPNQFLRMIENRFVTSEETFIPMEDWDLCTVPGSRPLAPTKTVPLFVGVDAATKRDAAAVVAVRRDGESVRLAAHRTWQPTPKEPLDLEETIEHYLRELAQQYWVYEVRYDPMQFVRSAQTLAKAGLPLVEWPQSEERITKHSQALFDLIHGHRLVLYPDAGLRLAAQRAIAKDTPRGWKITKEKSSHKIDAVVALAMACIGAVEQGQPDENAEVIVGWHSSAAASGFFPTRGSELADEFDKQNPW